MYCSLLTYTQTKIESTDKFDDINNLVTTSTIQRNKQIITSTIQLLQLRKFFASVLDPDVRAFKNIS